MRTPSGGVHAYYPTAPGRKQRCWQVPSAHIDFRGDGGYVIAPPSRIVVDGEIRTYDVIAVARQSARPMEATSLREFLEPPRRKPPAPSPSALRTGGGSEQVRLAVGRAVLELLAEGTFPFTTIEVAERAHVSRRTLYRWWPTQDHLLVEALSHRTRGVEVPDTGSWATDLRTFAHRVAAFAADPVDLTMTRIMVSGMHPDFNEALVAHYEPIRSGWHQMLERAVSRDQATATHEAPTVINALVSPLFLAPLTVGTPATPETADRLVDLVLDATRATDDFKCSSRFP